MCDVGKRIRDRRIELGYNAEELAHMVGLSPATIYRYENGDIKKVSTNKINPIAAALNTSAPYLMGWTDDPSETVSSKNETKVDSEPPSSDVVSEEAMNVAKAYDMMSDYGKSIIAFVVAQEEKQRKESFGKSKIMRAGTESFPSITSLTGFPVGHPAAAQAWYNAMQEQKELKQEETPCDS